MLAEADLSAVAYKPETDLMVLRTNEEGQEAHVLGPVNYAVSMVLPGLRKGQKYEVLRDRELVACRLEQLPSRDPITGCPPGPVDPKHVLSPLAIQSSRDLREGPP